MNATARAMQAAKTVAPTKNGSRPKPGEISAMDAAVSAGCHRSLVTDALLVRKFGTVEEIRRAESGSGLSAACARIRATMRMNDGVPQAIPAYLIDIEPTGRQGEKLVRAWVDEKPMFMMILKCRSAEAAASRLLATGYPDAPCTVRYGDLVSQEPRVLSHLAKGINWKIAA